MTGVYIVDIVRTPVGKAPRGLLKQVLPDDLLASVIQALMQRQTAFDWERLDDVVIGCAMPEAEQGMNIARMTVLNAGLSHHIPAMTLNRLCSSGLQSIASAAHAIESKQMSQVIAGGVESMSLVPLGGNKLTLNPKFLNQENIGIAYGMGLTAEVVAQKYKITRQEQDEFAYHSHQKALKAQAFGYFSAEISPVKVSDFGADLVYEEPILLEKIIHQDEGPRQDTTFEALSKLKPIFKREGTVTAGNSSQMSDGAAASLLVDEKTLSNLNVRPLGRMLSFAVTGVAPEVMGIGPIEAIPKALKMAGLKIQDLDWIELNEAFAAQALAVIKTLDLPLDKVNPQGGAIALGHPLGATGTIRTATLLHGLKRTSGRYGLVSMCIGVGMGAAAVFEVL